MSMCLQWHLPYYRARYYDPSIGRFISEDPITFAGSGTNFYEYVANNPANWTDPTGMCDPSKDIKECLEKVFSSPIDKIKIEEKLKGLEYKIADKWGAVATHKEKHNNHIRPM